MRATGSTHHHRFRSSARFRVGLATLIASSGLVSAMVFGAQRAGAATLTVTNCNAKGPGSLAKVVAGAAANSGITFSVTCPSISLTSPINLKVPVVITGPGASALEVIGPQGEGEDAFEVDPNVEVSISGLAFQNEYLGFVNEGTLALSACTMENDPNQSESEAIDNEGTLSVHDCQMTGNEANLNDNFSLGVVNNGSATMSDCNMEGYEANQGGGSAISNDGQLVVSQCSFAGNVGHFGGAAIESDGGSVNIARSTFTDNEAINSTGEQIANDAGTMDVIGTTVSGNKQGGGLSNGGTLSLNSSKVSSNVAGKGGGISNAGTLTVAGSTISGNTGLAGGGGIDSAAGPVTITGSTISNNFVHGKAHGGGISNDAGTMNIAESTVSGNNSNDGTGGGIFNDGAMSLTDSTVSSNTNEGGGAGIDNAGTLNASDSTVSKNTIQGAGGASGAGILNEPLKKSSAPSLVLTASTLAQNVGTKPGGGIENAGGGSATLAATVVAGASPTDCDGVMTDAGYNLDDDASCGFSSAEHSDSGVQPFLGPLQDNGGPTTTEEPALGSPLLDVIPTGTTANAMTLCPGTDQRGVARPQDSECDIGAVELSPTPQDITSSNTATATAGQTFSFTVTTTGTPTPKLSETGALPRKLAFTDNGDGTATISGTAKKAGSSELVIKANFAGYVVLQVFTLTVAAG
jgi:hypothetical protein